MICILHPSDWHAHGHWDYMHQCEYSTPILVNALPNKRNGPYIVVVHEDVEGPVRLDANCQCAVYVPGEDVSAKPAYNTAFLRQFDAVATNRSDLDHPHVVSTHYLHPWRIQKTRAELENIENLSKSRDLSAVVSDLTMLDGHKKRFAFMNKMKGHFKDRLDWYGKGIRPIEDKWLGLVDYKYSIAMENSQHPGYFTEKITDCFLAHTMPIYSGCPDVAHYFDDRSYIQIDLDDWKNAILKIEDAMASGRYAANLKYIDESRRLVLDKYNFVSAIGHIVKSNEFAVPKSRGKHIYPQRHFTPSGYRKLWNRAQAHLFTGNQK